MKYINLRQIILIFQNSLKIKIKKFYKKIKILWKKTLKTIIIDKITLKI